MARERPARSTRSKSALRESRPRPGRGLGPAGRRIRPSAAYDPCRDGASAECERLPEGTDAVVVARPDARALAPDAAVERDARCAPDVAGTQALPARSATACLAGAF